MSHAVEHAGWPTPPTHPRPHEQGFASNGPRKRGPDRAPAILDRRARDRVAARAARAAAYAGPADHRDAATGSVGRRQPPAGALHQRNAPASLTSAHEIGISTGRERG